MLLVWLRVESGQHSTRGMRKRIPMVGPPPMEAGARFLARFSEWATWCRVGSSYGHAYFSRSFEGSASLRPAHLVCGSAFLLRRIPYIHILGVRYQRRHRGHTFGARGAFSRPACRLSVMDRPCHAVVDRTRCRSDGGVDRKEHETSLTCYIFCLKRAPQGVHCAQLNRVFSNAVSKFLLDIFCFRTIIIKFHI